MLQKLVTEAVPLKGHLKGTIFTNKNLYATLRVHITTLRYQNAVFSG